MIQVLQNEALKDRHTFGIPARSAVLIETDEYSDLLDELDKQLPKYHDFLILGEGSNILFQKDFSGLIIHPDNQEIKIIDQNRQTVTIEAGAGLNWDQFVEWSMNHGWYGLENLSGIPGSIGAVPVQNIGAYGTEAAEWIDEVMVIDLKSGTSFWMNDNQCQFGYRDSIFKTKEQSAWLVWKVRFRLSTEFRPNVRYQALADYLTSQDEVSPNDVRQAILAIRGSKLPDPAKIGNAGSFFKNPIVSSETASSLLENYPDMPHYSAINRKEVKIPAGWLIEKAGLKGYRHKNAGVYRKQALVLVNHGNASGQEVAELAEYIQDKIKAQFGILLEPEVRII